ncbi:hypothetical protein CcaCcLH18_12841 [Colletotrichum camelliae]|nr:hypothetical protein CcaCcLH18_12841 [Colletotrichum camelliae]
MVFHCSSYKQYKHHTDVGFRWLYETAMKHRWRPNEAPKVADYVAAAQQCLRNGTHMPERQRQSLEIALDLRRKTSAWFRSQSRSKWRQADAHHAHFNDQLDRILQCFPSTIVSDSAPSPTPPSNGSWLSADANLDEASTDVDQRDWQEPNTGSDDELAEDLHYVSVEDDFLVDLFCLFKDAKNIREHLRGVWRRYREREIDVITAALITQLAFATFADLEAGFVRRHDDLRYIGLQIGVVHANAALGVPGLWKGPEAHWEAKFNDIKLQMKASEWKPSEEIEEETFRPTSIMLEILAILADETPIVKDDGELLELLPKKYAKNLPGLRRLIALYNEVQAGTSTDFDFLTKRLGKRPEPQRILLSTAFMCRVFLDIPEDVKVSKEEAAAFDQYIKSQLQHLKGSGFSLPGRLKSVATRRPMIYGLQVFDQLQWIQTAIITFANDDWKLVRGAHIYNFLKASSQSPPIWQDMEKLIELQERAIFIGEPPTTTDQCVRKLRLAQGLKPSELCGRYPDDHLDNLAAKRKTARHVCFGAYSDEAYTRWIQSRNAPGFRRELVPTTILEELHNQVITKKGCRLKQGSETLISASGDDVRSSKASTGRLALVDPESVSLPTRLEKTISREVSVTLFDFWRVHEMVTSSVEFGRGLWLDSLVLAQALTNVQKTAPNRLNTIFESWQARCRYVEQQSPF